MAIDFGALNAAVMEAFAEPERVAYQPRGEAGLLWVRAIYDRFQLQALLDGDAPVSVMQTQIGVCQADFPPGFVHDAGDRVQVRGISFVASDAQPDGQGWVYLPVKKIGSAGP
ncbi:head-tail joining protein [Teichococcus aestuarii]|uniref:head-tail joining protein n=1 Tax=Teichococcus aestuarii TaxID=568898 RepID=UPI003623951D